MEGGERESFGFAGLKVGERGAKFVGEVKDGGGEGGLVVFFPSDEGFGEEGDDGFLLFGFVVFEAVAAVFCELDGAESAFGGAPEVLPRGVKCG